jgi:hypothetical protein
MVSQVKNYYTSPKRGKVSKQKKTTSSREKPPWQFDTREEGQQQGSQLFNRGDNIRWAAFSLILEKTQRTFFYLDIRVLMNGASGDSN